MKIFKEGDKVVHSTYGEGYILRPFSQTGVYYARFNGTALIVHVDDLRLVRPADHQQQMNSLLQEFEQFKEKRISANEISHSLNGDNDSQNKKRSQQEEKGLSRGKIGAIVIGFIILLTLVTLPLFTERIEQGHVGVVYSPNGGVKKETLPPGWHMVGFFNKVTHYPVKLQTTHAKNMSLATSDGKSIKIDFSYNYNVDATKVTGLFDEFGPMKTEELQSSYLRTRLKNAARNEISQYSVLELYGSKSNEISTKIQNDFAKDVAKYGIVIDGLVLGTPHPDAATQAAIDATVKAKQDLERKNTELEIAKKEAQQKLIEAQSTANAKIAEAKGEAESTLVKAQAQAQANRELNASLTENVLKKMELDARYKNGWVTVQGANTVVTK
jgi:regulator of protease activity HflC (stomatin/prohibitin superfamily)